MAWVGPSNLKICHIGKCQIVLVLKLCCAEESPGELVKSTDFCQGLAPKLLHQNLLRSAPSKGLHCAQACTHTHTQGTGGELVLVVFSQLWETLLGGKGFPWWCPLSGVCTLRSEGAGSDPVYFCPLTSEPLPFPYLIRHCCQLFFWSKQ